MDIFDQNLINQIQTQAPLAARMRPRTLDEFVGQDHIIGPGRLLRRAISLDQLSSLIFYGPPGTGKTTLARVIANTTRAHFLAINAVLSGVKEIRAAIDTAQEQRKFHNQRTILFVDEVHRFNKSQQDALLPWVENGTVILIGATTENPYFEVNKALVSRSRIFQLKALNDEDLYKVVEQTLTDEQRGYGRLKVKIDDEALKHLVNVANGDARSLLNALELAVETTPPDETGVVHINLAVAEESIQQRAVLYDKEGDVHFDTVSAFIKSLRGSDPDAALYWLAKMVYAGEDPRFIFRRMLILASEDVGLADPNAVVVVNACNEAFDRVGMPEGRYHLAQAALYLATAAKSNSVMEFFDALAAIEQEKEAEVPNNLKDANRDKKGFGHGAGYLYPYAYRDHWVAQQYLPATLQGQVFYQPSLQGRERQISTEVSRRREAQLAALVEGNAIAPLEILTYATPDRASERWLQRTLSQVGTQLATVRDRIFELAQLQRHHVVLELNAGSGLLTWEAVRQTPEGGVYACVRASKDANALSQQAASLKELIRPQILQASIPELVEVITQQAANVQFDFIIGRNVLVSELDKSNVVQNLAKIIPQRGRLILAETVPRYAQRLYRLLEDYPLDSKLYKSLMSAEEAIYDDGSDPMLNWDMDDLRDVFKLAGLEADVIVELNSTQMHISSHFLERLFTDNNDRPSYAQRLGRNLTPEELQKVKAIFAQYLLNQTILWESTIAFIQVNKK
ncbi:AAA family ATPase (plasmid) [Trichormus variabilis ARAD]|uniref:AAA family ATPase n=1 Tax=Trichormus variabilis N2B TaxID=2681315 RepID=A0ABR6SGH1_ANAVA|nr:MULTISPECIES: AAA family ATPase [Nostocaceae]MBC1217987.1 AAA family ATPase [Trichormus variabilis ARAD]MBC1259098.1 AAA family ATPase [Trichormus variabilis V5]MBC1270642.1 AAA family ATPase [Trichormus variabilis FSR]MBC1305496.1 AAA family ATPase [Trichormus variabilis N2B]MBC1314544.1 AAA family ATPase [Trichormus variabilis PNB]